MPMLKNGSNKLRLNFEENTTVLYFLEIFYVVLFRNTKWQNPLSDSENKKQINNKEHFQTKLEIEIAGSQKASHW